MLGLGYVIGKLEIGDFTLGGVTGVLIAGVLIGQLDIRVSNDLKSAFFLLFPLPDRLPVRPAILCTLKTSGLPRLALTLIMCATASPRSTVPRACCRSTPACRRGACGLAYRIRRCWQRGRDDRSPDSLRGDEAAVDIARRGRIRRPIFLAPS